MLHSLITTLTLASSALAICTDWEGLSTGADTGSSFSTTYSIPVDNLICPASQSSNCRFNQTTYHIVAERDLTSTGLRSLNDLPSDELDAIFNLAQDAFNDRLPRNGTSDRDFITREGNVTSPESRSIIARVEPGTNKTLLYTAFYQYSSGILGGCSNSSLNNLTVTAASPYLVLNEFNRSVIAGTWGTSTRNITSSASVSAHVNVVFGATVAALAAVSLVW